MIYFLIGFMGSGKSTVGKLLAEKLQMSFSDTDAMIEEQTGLKISEIFEKEGEDHFRMLERKIVRELDVNAGVVSCGGGLPCYNDLMGVLLTKGTVIYLRASEEALFERLQHATKDRPLLDPHTLRETISKRLSIRSSCYESAQIIIDTDDLSADEVVAKIVERLAN